MHIYITVLDAYNEIRYIYIHTHTYNGIRNILIVKLDK